MDYEEALQKALAAANSRQAQQSMSDNITAGDNTYNQIAAQTANNRSLEQQRLAQRMAEMGIAAPSSLTVTNNAAMSGNKDIGSVRTQQQGYANTQNAMINQTNANAAAQAAGFKADMDAAENASILDEATSKLERYYRLFANRKMTSSQFKKLTGIDVKAYGTAKKKKPSIGDFFQPSAAQQSLINVLNQQVNNGAITSDQAYDKFMQGKW